MTDNKHQSRRRILQTLIASGAAATTHKMLPDNWSKPVVDSVLVPAHAEISGDPDFPTGIFRTGRFSVSVDPDPLKHNETSVVVNDSDSPKDVMDFFIGTADAVDEYPVFNCTISCETVFNGLELAFSTPDSNPGGIDICVSSFMGSSQGSSSINGTSIKKALIDGYALTNMTATLEEVTGNISFKGNGISCKNRPFTAPRVRGPFFCSNTNSTIKVSFVVPCTK